MTHPTAEDLQKYLSDEISEHELQGLEAHLNDCEVCLDYLDSLQRTWTLDRHVLAGLLVRSPDEPDPFQTVNGSRPGQPPYRNGTASREGTGSGISVPDQSGFPQFPGYELLARVSCGGMGEIYQARQQATGRIVALKTLTMSRVQDGERLREMRVRFRREIEAVNRVQHPNIVAVYDVGERDGRPYYTMEWIDGGSLAERLGGKPQDERRAVRWLAALARAVHYLHERGIIHRDLKPGNLLLGPEDVIKIADFGVAKLTDRSDGATRAAQWLGTPEYMAPEQAGSGGRNVGSASDIYALGVLFYEMLTGRPPFRADEPLETLRQVRSDEPVSPRRLRPRLSRELETVCLKCLDKNPARRYASAQLLAEDLEHWLEGRPIAARPTGTVRRTAKWARRHPERAALVASILLFALLTSSAYFWQIWSANAHYARQLADSADYQLLLVKYAVSQTAQDGELRDLLADPEANRSRLRAYLVKTKEQFVRWFTRPGENVPIVNWFVMDPDGTIVADSYDDPNSVGKDYRFRDYYQGGMKVATADKQEVYVSRVYESEQDDRYKFTAITRVGGSRLYGLLGASLAVDSKLVALDMKKEAPGAVIVGPSDPNMRPKAHGDELPPFLVVLHRDYAHAGQKPIAVRPEQLTRLAAFASEPERREDSDKVTDRGCFLNYARVGDSGFVAIVEQPYPWPFAVIMRIPITTWFVIVPGLLLLFAVLRNYSRLTRGQLAT
jgi:serine/threonine-protein kinase